MSLCTSCGADWDTGAWTPGCDECGGGALQRACPICEGACGRTWHRAITDSQDARVGHWVGGCGLARAFPTYRFRFFFDTGSGTCLWATNDAARERFGYAVDVEQLPLPTTLRRRGHFLIAWYDTFLNWENAPEPSLWWAREVPAFNAAAREWLALLQEHLGPEFDVVDESGTAPADRSG